MFLFGSSARGVQGNDDKEFNSSLLCYFVSMLEVFQVHNDEEFDFLLSCIFLFQ